MEEFEVAAGAGGLVLGDFICFRGTKTIPLTDRTFLFCHPIEGQIETPAKKYEQEPIEFLVGHNVAVAKIAKLRSTHLLVPYTYEMARGENRSKQIARASPDNRRISGSVPCFFCPQD
jgi:hypothetical protein